MKVFVLSRAGKWLKEKRARIVRREPFTIRLRFAAREHVQPVKVGVDTGSKVVGIAATANSEVVFQAEGHLRGDIAEKLVQRRQYRRARRSRKTRYRPARWANRHHSAAWLPVRQVNVEIASFDTQRIQHPEISGIAYQQGELFGYHLREYLLEKWQRKCAYCGSKEIPLQVEHQT